MKVFLIILAHLGFWAFNTSYLILVHKETIPEVLTFYLAASVPFYLNYFVFIPLLIRNNKLVYFILWLVVVLGLYVAAIISWAIYYHKIQDPDYLKMILISMNVGIYYEAISTGGRLIHFWIMNNLENKKLLTRKMSAQINMLKSQINIPFMVQALSTIEQKAAVSPGGAAAPVLQLANVLRYTLYETNNNETELVKELEILSDYIALLNESREHKIKLEAKVENENATTPSGFLLKVVENLVQVINPHIKETVIFEVKSADKLIITFSAYDPLIPDTKLRNLLSAFPLFKFTTESEESKLIIQLENKL